MTFRVVASADHDAFCQEVQKALRDGWTLKGEEMFVEYKYVQVFLKFPENIMELKNERTH